MGSEWSGSERMGKKIVYQIFNNKKGLFVVYYRVKQSIVGEYISGKMKRRDFIRVSSAAGIAGLVGPGYSAMANTSLSKENGFDLHPFIKEHPEAVFINLTSVEKKTDAQPIYDAAYKLADEMFVKTKRGKGYSNTTKITTKPNWTCSGRRNTDPESKLGITLSLIHI